MRCVIFLLLFSSVTFAQGVNLDSFLDKAQKATMIYREIFNNLVAEELRTYEYYRKDETLEDKRKIKSIFIVEYKQTKSTLRIKANPTAEELKQEPSGISFDAFLPVNFRPTNLRLQGKLWLDAETAQLWRDEFSVTIQPAFLSMPVVSANFVNEYQSSEFGILLPKKLWMLTNRFAGSNEQTMVVTKAAQKTFEYTKFSKPSAEGKDVILKK